MHVCRYHCQPPCTEIVRLELVDKVRRCVYARVRTGHVLIGNDGSRLDLASDSPSIKPDPCTMAVGEKRPPVISQ
jgi:hypothetical protein